MAYVAFQDLGGAAGARALTAARRPVAATTGRLTRLEWSVVICARRDGRGSIGPESRATRALRRLSGRPNPRLSDRRLEALRRMAVLAWRDGYTVASHEVRTFIAAGFSVEQYEAVVNHVSAARLLPPRTVRSA